MSPVRYLIFLLLFVSCTKVVVLELDPVPPRLVLNASVEAGKDVSAFLSKSWFLMDSVPDGVVAGGKIQVYVNDVLKGSMLVTDNPADTIHPKGQFSLPGCRLQSGDRLRLEAEAPGFDRVKGETWIPGKVEISAVDTSRFLASGDMQMRFITHFKDNPDERDFYRLIMEKIVEYRKGDSVRVTNTFAYPWLTGNSYYYYNNGYWMESPFGLDYEDPVFQPPGSGPALNQLEGTYCRGVFPDDQFNGEEYALRVVTGQLQDSYRGDSIVSTVQYKLHLLSISQPYYNYMKIIRGISITLGNAFLEGMVEPTKTYTNVDNGFGVVAGYQISSAVITMPFRDKEPAWTPWDPTEY